MRRSRYIGYQSGYQGLDPNVHIPELCKRGAQGHQGFCDYDPTPSHSNTTRNYPLGAIGPQGSNGPQGSVYFTQNMMKCAKCERMWIENNPTIQPEEIACPFCDDHAVKLFTTLTDAEHAPKLPAPPHPPKRPKCRVIIEGVDPRKTNPINTTEPHAELYLKNQRPSFAFLSQYPVELRLAFLLIGTLIISAIAAFIITGVANLFLPAEAHMGIDALSIFVLWVIINLFMFARWRM